MFLLQHYQIWFGYWHYHTMNCITDYPLFSKNLISQPILYQYKKLFNEFSWGKLWTSYKTCSCDSPANFSYWSQTLNKHCLNNTKLNWKNFIGFYPKYNYKVWNTTKIVRLQESVGFLIDRLTDLWLSAEMGSSCLGVMRPGWGNPGIPGWGRKPVGLNLESGDSLRGG